MIYRIEIIPTALKALSEISDRRIRDEVTIRIERLACDPEKRGKPLSGELSGLRSLRAAGQRYRVIYRIENSKVQVLILAIGIRKEGDKKDIYQLAKKLVRLQLI